MTDPKGPLGHSARQPIWVAMALATFLCCGSLVFAQEADDAETAAEDEAAVLATMADIDQILLQDEAVLSGESGIYDAGDRRDPFISLLVARQQARELTGERPEGIPGLLVDEIDLTGIYVTGAGPVAQVQAGNQSKSYLLRPKDQLFDGDVVSISKNEVVFKQIVDDPTALKPFRVVVKKLNPEPGT